MKLDDFLKTLDPSVAKQFKKASAVDTAKLPLASKRLTRALGGGIGQGRITMLYGNTSAGKSAIMIQSIGKWQKQGLVCAYFDVEGTWDNDWAERLGVDNDALLLVQKRSFGAITDQMRPLLLAEIDVIVVDSISMALPDVFIDKDGIINDYEDQRQMMAHAKACTVMVNAIHYSNENTAIVLLSQTTIEKGTTYTKQVPHGGNKVKFASTQMIKIASSGTEANQIKEEIKVGDSLMNVFVARQVDGIVEKNKMAPPNKKFSYIFRYEGDFVGIDYIGETADDSVDYKVVDKKGAWLYYGELKWQGRPAFVSYLREHPELVDELDRKVEEVLML